MNSGAGSCIWVESSADTLSVTNTRLLYGYNSIYYIGGGTGAYFAYNLCDTPGSAGIYCNNHTNARVIGNQMNIADFGAGSGHYTAYALRMDGCNTLTVANNRAISTAVNSAVSRTIVFTGTTGSRNMVYNNTCSNTGGALNCNGMAINACSNLYIMNNNLLVTSSLTDGAALFFYGLANSAGPSPNCQIINNNLINKGAGFAILAESNAVAAGSIDTFDYNSLYSGGKYLAQWDSSYSAGTGRRKDLSVLKTLSGKCANCLNLDPGFVSTKDLHVSSIGINGKGLYDPLITTDMDGETRNTSTPDIGSDEFFPITTDAGLSAIDSPAYFCPGKQVVKVKFQNFGVDPITSVNIGWSVNGVTQTGISWSGTLASGLSSASLSLGLYTFSSNTAYNFKIWTSNPNGAPDGKPINDTLQIRKYPAMSGFYTIGDTSIANYKSFNAAVTDVADRGMCGAVTFNVYNGIYKEQLGLTQLPGMGVNSPLTFQSINKDSTKVVMTLPAVANQGSNNAMVQLRGASYVTFRGMTFERTGSITNPFAQVIHIIANSHYNTFTNCQMLGMPNTNVATHVNIWSDQSTDNYNTFRNNYIKGGLYNIQFNNGTPNNHEMGTVIENNVFEGSWNSPINLANNDKVSISGNTFLTSATSVTSCSNIFLLNCDSSVVIDNNTFNNTNADSSITMNNCKTRSKGGINIRKNTFVSAADYDILLTRCDSFINISNNIFKNPNVGTSIILNACDASSSKHALIANNVFMRSTGKGISIDSSDNFDIVFNSFNFTGSSGSNSAFTTVGANTNLRFLNNNIVMQSGEAYHITFATEMAASSNNNLYTRGVDFAYLGGVYGNLSDLLASSGKESNSFSINPMFTSNSDLHMRNPLLKGQGIPVAGITTDMDGELRSSTKPDIGADEFKLSPNDAGIVELVSPVAGACAGKLNLEVVIKNFGNDTLKNAVITWTAQNIAQTPYNWTGSLPTNGVDTFVIGDFNFLAALNPKFKFVSTLPNGQIDGIDFNDTLITNRSLRALPTAYAGPDRTVCFGDTLNIGGNSNAAFSYKWMTLSNIPLGTNSRLNIKPGTQTSYVLEVTNTAFGCKKNDTVKISVNTLPSVNAGTDKDVCPGSSAQIGSAAQSGVTYGWTSSPAGFTSASANPSVTPLVATEYYIKATNTTTGCKNMDTVKIGLSPEPTVNISGASAVCDGEVQSFSTPGATGDTYNWKVTGGTIQGSQIGSSINVRWDVSGPGVIELIETNTATCKDTNSYMVTVNPRPTAAFNATTACFGSPTNFTDLSVGATSYKWEFGDGANSTAKDPTHTYPNAINYNPTLIVKSGSGCADTTSIQVGTNPLPVVDFTYSRQPNRTYDFNDISTVSSGTISSWMWDFGDGDSATVKQPSHHFLVGSYTIKLCVKSNTGCESCKTQNLNVVGIDPLTFDKNLFVMPNPGSGVFTVNSSKAMETIVITNAMGQVLQTITPDNNIMKIDLTAEPAGVYFIRVEINGQSSTLKLVKQ